MKSALLALVIAPSSPQVASAQPPAAAFTAPIGNNRRFNGHHFKCF